MSLQKRLDAIRKGFEAKAPAEAVEAIHRATGELRGSGLEESALKEGDPAPQTVLERLNDRPLVVTFYRGRW